MTKQQIRFRCQHTYPRYEFETNKWWAYSDTEDVHGPTVVVVQATCPECKKRVTRQFSMSEIFEILMKVPE